MTQISLSHQQLDLKNLSSLSACGVSAVDIYVGNDGHIKLDEHLNQAAALHELLLNAKLECGLVRSTSETDDIDSIVKLVEIARALNCEFITVQVPRYKSDGSYRSLLAQARGCYQDLNQISAETGVDALITLCPLAISANADAAMRILEGLDPSHVGVLFKPGDYDTELALKRDIDILGPYLRAISCGIKEKSVVELTIKESAQSDLLVSLHSADAQAVANFL